jgi:hypothetical protein
MSELLQRFRERFQMWHEERLHGPSGPPAGYVADAAPHRDRSTRNPLSWAMFGAIVSLLPPYHFRDPFDLLLPASGLVFLAFYFARSRYAWHVLAAELFIVTPAFVFLSFSWRFQRAMHPWIIWVPIIGTLLIAALLFWSRQRYFAYLEQRKAANSGERI